MFDLLTQKLMPMNFGASDAAAAPDAAKKVPPPPKAAPALPPTADPHPGAISEVFAGMVDGDSGMESSLVGGQQQKPAPPQAHHLEMVRPDPFGKETYRHKDYDSGYGHGGDESEEAYRERLQRAAGGFGDKVLYSDAEGYEAEGNLSRRQRAWWNGFNSEDRKEKLSEKKLAALKIGLNEGNLALAHDTPVRDLESPAGRMETLNILSQNMDPNDPDRKKTDEVSCAGASIVGGVLLAGGKEGLQKLLTACHDPNAKEETPEEKELRAKLASGNNLTLGDLQDLQQMVYRKLKENEDMGPKEMEKALQDASDPKKTAEERAEATKSLMVGQKGMEKFMDASPAIAEMFAKNKLDLVSIDTDLDKGNNGDGSANHAVLRINGPDGQPIAYYDPWKKKGDQGQIINAQDEDIKRSSHEMPAAVLDDYKKAERIRGHFDQDKNTRETNKLLTKAAGRDPSKDQYWWTDEGEAYARRKATEG